MSDFSFLAVPNVEGMRLLWYIQIVGIVFLFGISLFFVLYFWLRYRKKQAFFHQLDDIDHHAQILGQQLLQQNIRKSSGKSKLVLFIEYLEKFVTTDIVNDWSVYTYANLWELLLPQWFSPKEIEEFEQVLYMNKQLSLLLEEKIDKSLTAKTHK